MGRGAGLRPTVAFVALAALLAGAPLAQAASAVWGDVHFDAPPVLGGRAAWRAADGALDVAPALGEAPQVSWGVASGRLVATRWYVVAAPAGTPQDVESSHTETPLSWPAGSIQNLTCDGD